MKQRARAAVTALAFGTVVLAWAMAGLVAKAPAADDKKKADELFGLTRVWQLHLDLPDAEWKRMQPAGGMGGPGGFGRPREATPDSHRNSGFGLVFPWGRGSFTAGGTTFDNVGIRYKGNFSYMISARGLKRNFKVELDHYEEDHRFHGLRKLNLNAGAADPTRMREALAFAVFRAAGVPAPRTAFAEVTLTVPGKYDKEYLGIYTLIEQVDKTFLKDRFKDGKGLLMKPEGVRAFDYLGDDWAKYKPRYQPKHEASKQEAERVIAFAKLIHKADDEQFRKEVGSYLDIDEFLRFLAANSLVVNLDSFFSMGHNYYVYLNPKTNKFVFIPWDLDLSFAGMGMFGSSDQLLDLSLTHPHGGENKLIDRLLAIKEVNEKYQKLLKELATTCFTKERVLKDLEAIEKTMKEPLAREKKAREARKEPAPGFGPGPGMTGQTPDLRTMVAKRAESLVAQADGKSKGYTPRGGFGFGGPGGPGGPGGFRLGDAVAKPLREALDGDKDGKVTKDELIAGIKKFFRDSDKDNKGKLDEKALADGLNRIWPMPPGAPRAGPGGFGPGTFLAGAIVKRADADKDGKVTLDELVAAAEALFKEADKDKKGALDEKGLAAAVDLLSPPAQFGPPGGFGPGNGLARPLLQALEADKDGKLTKDKLLDGVRKFFKECDKDNKGKLDEKALTDGLTRILPRPRGFGPGPGGPQNGTAAALAGAIVKRADADKDGKVTLDELLAAAEALFKEADKDKKGALDERAVTEAINKLMPAPQGFGPPGNRPGDSKEDKKEEKKP